MNRTVGLGLAVLIVGVTMAAAWAGLEQERTQKYVIVLSTKIDMPMKMPAGMPAMGGAGGRTGQPYRMIDGTAVYTQQAVDPIFVTVPGDLKLPDNRLILHTAKPATGGVATDQGKTGEAPAGKMEMTSKLYWHPDKAEGPITETFQVDTGRRGGMMGGGPDLSKLYEKADPDRTAQGSESKLPDTVVGKGSYPLNTGGTAMLDGFLPPIKILNPPDLGTANLADGLKIEWEPVAGARGYILHANGMNMDMSGGAQNMKITITQWVSTLSEPPMRVRASYRQETTIADDLKNGILLPAGTTGCVIPPGVFGDVMMFHLSVMAVGNDFYSQDGGITVVGTIRSEWTAGAMRGMPGMGR